MAARDDDQLTVGRLRVSLFSAALALAALPALWWLGLQPGPSPGSLHLGVIAVVTALFVASEIFTIDVEFRHESQSLTFTSVPLIVGLAILPPAVVLAIRVATMVAVFVGVQKQPPYKLAFNTATAILDTALVATIMWFAPDGPFGPWHWAIAFAAVVAGDAFSAIATTAAISLFQGRWEPGSLGEVLIGTVAAAVDVSIAVVAVTLMQQERAAVVVLLGLGAFVVALFRAYARVRSRYRALELLDGFTRAVGESVLDGSVVTRLLTESAEILHADRAWLVSLGPTDDLRFERHERGVRPSPAEPIDYAILDALDGSAVLFEDEGELAAELAAAGLDEVIAAPLVTPGEIRYALVIADRSGEVRPFDGDDVALFETLAVHAGLALQNLDLVDRLRTEIEITEHTATHDALTSLPNRTRFQHQLDRELTHGGRVAVLLLDLDRFKEVNDTLGHRNGDELLVEVGRRLCASFPDDAVARLGGDEFVVMLRDWTDPDDVANRARRLLDDIRRPFAVSDVTIDVSASIGIAVGSGRRSDRVGETDSVTLLRQADIAMYVAKEDRSGVEVYSADRDHYSPQRLALVGRLRTAIEQSKLELHYQPQLDLATGHVIGVEALVRWPQPGRTPIPPDEFIYIAEHTGLIHPLTQFVLDKAIGQAAQWNRDGRGLRMSLNLSAHDLGDVELVGRIERLLAHHGLPPSMLMVELTESAVMSNPALSVRIMQAIRDIGVAIAIDDFGTGHSSLAYLTGVPATELKIDQSFVFAMGSDPAATTIVRAIVDLGRNLGLELVAEGVETEAHAAALASMGCDVVQGYFYSRPLEPRGLELWLEHRVIAAPRDRDAPVQ